MWSPDFTCGALTVPLAKADARQCVSSSLLPQDKRDGIDFSTAYVPQGITMAKVNLFLSIKKPLNKRRYGCVSISPVFFCFSLHPPCLVLLPCLSAGAGLDGHIGINLEDWVPGFILVEHGQRAHLFWDTAGLRNPRDDSNGSDYALDGGMVRRPRHLGEFEWRRWMQRRKLI